MRSVSTIDVNSVVVTLRFGVVKVFIITVFFPNQKLSFAVIAYRTL